MNFAFLRGENDAPASVIHSDSSSGFIVVPDAHLLFTAHFSRVGPDLVLVGDDGQRHIIPDYFASEHQAALMAPNGASLAPDLVDLLAGSPTPGEYAQAAPTAPPDSIGKVAKVVGTVTAERNGVAVTLNFGDAVYKSDVIVTAANSAIGIAFPDGTALQVVANSRMALNDYSYDANSNSNSALFTLVDGTFAFVAGKVAHTGDMKIATPVATMGIRGTTGVVEKVGTLNVTNGNLTWAFTLYDDPGRTTHGAWDMSVTNPDGTSNVIATVSQTGYVTYVTPQGIGLPPIVSTQPLPDSQANLDQQILSQLFDMFGATPHTNGGNGSPESPYELLPQDYIPGAPTSPFIININLNNTGGKGSTPTDPGTPPTPTYFIWPSGTGSWDHPPGWDVNLVPVSPLDTVEIQSGTSQYNNSYVINYLIIDPKGTLDVVGGTLTTNAGMDDSGLLLVDGDPPVVTVYGLTKIETGGTAVAKGAGSVLDFFTFPQQSITTDKNYGTIAAKDGGDVTFYQVKVTNEPAGTATNSEHQTVPTPAGKIVSSGAGATVDFTQVDFDNAGHVVGKNGGGVFFVDTAVENEVGATIVAKDHGSVTFALSSATASVGFTPGVMNYGAIDAKFGGMVDVEVTIVNEAGGRIGAIGDNADVTIDGVGLDNFGAVSGADGGTVKFDGGTVTDETGATIKARDFGAVKFDAVTLVNESGATIEAERSGVVKIHDGTVTNDAGAVVEAKDSGAVHVEDAAVSNLGGTIDATDRGTVAFKGEGGSVTNSAGTIEAKNRGTIVFDALSGVTNEDGGKIEAKDHGTVDFHDVAVANDDGLIEAVGCAAVIELAAASIADGTLQTRDGGVIESVYGDSTLTNVTLNGAVIKADHGTSLMLDGGTSGPAAVIDKTVTFEGSGVFTMANQSAQLVAGAHGGVLINDSKIDGLGQIGVGDGALNFVNHGTVEAQLAAAGHGNAFIIDTGLSDSGATATNTGVLEAQGAGAELIIENTTLDNTDGTIAAHGAGAVVEISNTAIAGGTFVTDDPAADTGGIIEILSPDAGDTNMVVFDGSGQTLTVDGYVQVQSAATLELIGVIDDDGTVEVDSVVAGADLAIDGTVTLDGSGVVILDGTNDIITGVAGSAATLENSSTIVGDGSIGTGDDALTLINEATGRIGTSGDNTLAIDTGDNIIVNDGVMGATRDGTLDVESKLDNWGAVVATHYGSVDIEANIHDEDGSTVEAKHGGTITLDNIRIANDNGATIVAADKGSTVTVDGSTVDNDGMLTAKAGGDISLTDATIHNRGGLIEAAGDGSTVDLAGVTIDHGTLKTDHGGLIETVDGNSTIDGVTIAGGSEILVNDGTSLTLEGTIENHGTIDIDGDSGAQLIVAAAVTLRGSGNVTLDMSDDEIVAAANGATLDNVNDTVSGGGAIGDGSNELTLTNEVGGTIEATGGVGDPLTINTGSNVIVNDGAMRAGWHDTLVIDSTLDNSGTVVASHQGKIDINADAGNTGTIEAETGGHVVLTGSTVNNDGGLVEALGSHSTVDLASSVIDNGTLTTSDGGLIQTINGASTFDAVTITGGSKVLVNDGTSLTLEGAITNGGTIDVDGNAGAQLIVDGDVTLSGGGTVTLDTADDVIVGAAGGGTLDNVDNTISGSGAIGDGSNDLTLTNEIGGTIEATGGSSDPLTISTGSNTITNDGAMDAAWHNTLVIDSDLDNSGTVIASHHGKVDLNADVQNSSTIEAEHGGHVTLTDSTVDNSGGLIEAVGPWSTVNLSDAAIDDGTLTTSHHGLIQTVDGNSTFDAVAITDGSEIKVNDGTSLTLEGTIANGGTIDVDGGSGASLIVDGTVTLNGGGKVTLDTSADEIVGAAGGGTLDNVDNTISGSGAIGDGSNDLTLINEADGTIQATGGAGDPLTVNTGSNAISNEGVMEAVGPNTLVVDSALDNSGTVTASLLGKVDLDADVSNTSTIEAESGGHIALTGSTAHNAGGLIEAIGSGSTVDLSDAAIDDGTLTTSDDGLIQTVADNSTFDAVTISDGSEILVNDGTSLTLEGTIANGGTIDVDGGSGASLIVDGTVTLSGGGKVTLDTSNDEIVAAANGGTLDNVNDTISGGGAIGDGSSDLTLTNEIGGTIDATGGAGDPLTINTGGNTVTNDGAMHAGWHNTLVVDSELDNSGTVVASHNGKVDLNADAQNTGTIEAERGGHVTLTDSIVDNAGGLIEAVGHWSTVDLAGASIDNGSLTTSHHGLIQTVDGNSTFDAVTITDGSEIKVNDGTSLTLEGAIANGGTIDVDGDAGAQLIVDGEVTLSGGGAVTLDTADDEIVGAASGGTLDNVDNTISGGGAIGDGSNDLTLTNEIGGTIEATDGAGDPLTIDTGDNTVTNDGTMAAGSSNVLKIDSALDNAGEVTASNQGEVDINADVGNTGTIEAETGGHVVLTGSTVNNAGGLIEAIGSDSTINLASSAIDDGSLTTSDDGLIQTVDGNSTFDAVTITGGSKILVNDGTSLTLEGAITNGGTIDVDGDAGAQLIVDGDVTLSGGGTVTLDTADDEIVGAAGGGTLDNVDNTISGGGAIGDGSNELTLTNEIGGTIEATGGAGDPLTLNTGSNTVTNDGAMDAAWHSTLVVDSDLDNSGTVIASHHGKIDLNADGQNTGTIEAENAGHVTLTDSTVDNTGGLIEAVGRWSTIDLSGATIDDGTLTTSHHGLIQTVDGASTFDAVTITDGSEIRVNDGTSLALEGAIKNGGTIDVDGDDNGAALVIDGTVTLNGGGDVRLDTADDAIVAAAVGATLDNVDNMISGGGTIGNGSNELTLINELDGTIAAAGGACDPLVIDTGHNTVTNDGAMDAAWFNVLAIDSKLDNAGTVTASHHGEVDIDANVRNTGTLEAEKDGRVVVTDATVHNTGGTIEATGAGSKVELAGVTIDRGTLETSDCAVVETVAGDNTFDGVKIADGSAIEVDACTVLMLEDTIRNGGTIAAERHAEIFVDGATVHNGGGLIEADGAGSTIELSGATIDYGTLASGDCGIIETACGDSTLDGVRLAGGSEVRVNDGTVLTLEDHIRNGGTIETAGGNATVDLVNATVSGGTLATGSLTSDAGGVFEVVATGAPNLSELDGTTHKVTIDGYVQVDAGAALELAGKIDNLGTIDVDGAAGADLVISGTVTLEGTGAVVLDDCADAIVSDGASATLDNFSTISGEGTIGDDTLTLFNKAAGVIDADAGGALIIDTGSAVHNHGLLEATDGATLDIESDVHNNATGEIAAVGEGSRVKLEAVTVSGGTVSIDSGATLAVESGTTVLRNVDVENSGTLRIDDDTVDAALTLRDNTTVDGAIVVGRVGELVVDSATFNDATLTVKGLLDIDGTLTLDGTDTIVIRDNGFVDGDGTIDVTGTTKIIGGTVGTVDIGNDATLKLYNADAATVDFTGTDGKLVLGAPGDFSGDITGLIDGDTIDFKDTAIASAVVSGDTLIVTIAEASGQYLSYDIDVDASAGTFDTNYFAIQSDGHGGDELVLTAIPAPSIAPGPEAGAVGANGQAAAQGSFSASDADPNAVIAWTIDNGAPAQSGTDWIDQGTFGTLDLTQSGTWTYTLDTDAGSAYEALSLGQSATETFTVQAAVSGDANEAATQTITITVTGDGGGALPAVTENVAPANVAGETVAAIFNNQNTAATGTVLTGIAVAGNTGTGGAWEYSSDDGTTWKTIPTDVSATSALILAASDLLRFVPTTDYSGAVSPLSVYGLDSASVADGTRADLNSLQACLIDPAPVAIGTSIIAVAVAPDMQTPTTVTLNEGGTAGLVIADTPADPNDTLGNVKIAGLPSDVTLSAGTEAANGTWTVIPAELSGLTLQAGEVDGDTSITVTVTASAGIDGETASVQETFALDLTTAIVVPPNLTMTVATASADSLTIESGGTLTGNGKLTVSGATTITGGTESGGGTTLAESGAAFFDAAAETFKLLDYTLELAGASSAGAFSGDIINLVSVAALTIDAGKTFSDQSSGTGLTIESTDHTGELVIHGTFDFDGTGSTTIGAAIDNDGVLETGAGGTLYIAGNVDNVGGAISASGLDSSVQLDDVTISGGTLSTDSLTSDLNSWMGITGGDTAEFDGSAQAVTVDGYVLAGSNATLELKGAIHDPGTIDLSAGATLTVDGTATLDNGTGTTNGTILDGAMTISAGGTLTIDDFTLTGTTVAIEPNGTLTADDDTFSGVTLYDDGTLGVDAGHALTLAGIDKLELTGTSLANAGTIDVTGTTTIIGGSVTSVDIGNNATLVLDGTAAQTVDFTGTDGTLKLGSAAAFHGVITDFTGTDPSHSDTIDLVGYGETSELTSTSGGDTTITLTGSGGHALITLDGFTGSLNFSSDAQDDFFITDPPASATTDAATSTTQTGFSADGTLTFADDDSSGALSASITPQGTDYLGHMSFDAVSGNDGGLSVGYNFSLSSDQVDLAPGQTVTQSYEVNVADAQNPAAASAQMVSVSIGGVGNDNFVFAPGIGADTIVNFNPQHDTLELDHFANVQNVQELAALVTSNGHGDAMIDLGGASHDSITLPGLTPAQLQAVLQTAVHIH